MSPAACVFCGREVHHDRGTMAFVHDGEAVLVAGAACSQGFGCSYACSYPRVTMTRDVSTPDEALVMMSDYAFLRWSPGLADAFHDAAVELCGRKDGDK